MGPVTKPTAGQELTRPAAKYSGASRPKVASAPLTAGPMIVPMLLAVPSLAMVFVRCASVV